MTEKLLLATGGNMLTLRILRVAKVGRIAQRMKTLKSFDSMQVLLGSIKASMSVLVWATFFLLVCHMLAALAMNSMLESYMTDEKEPLVKRAEVYSYFGTFTRSMT